MQFSRMAMLTHLALGAMLMSSASTLVAERYANQEVSYAKPASQPSTGQVQSPRDSASRQEDTANFKLADVLVSSATAPDNSQPQANLGDTATHEVGHRRVKQDIEVENDETHVAVRRTETVDNDETVTVGGNGSGSKQDARVAQRPAAYSIPEKDDEVVLTTASSPQAGSESYREGGTNDTTFRTKRPRGDRNGARGKRIHKP
jgi:hypothetical protein